MRLGTLIKGVESVEIVIQIRLNERRNIYHPTFGGCLRHQFHGRFPWK